jgi:DNA repair protein RecO (recombination protein O)
MMTADTLEPAYLLHSRRYRNTSVLIEILTPNHGRLGAVIKGVFSKGKHAQQLRSQLQLATPLLISISGRSELKSVTHLEAVGRAQVAHAVSVEDTPAPAPAPNGGNALYCVMYLNELLVRLLPVSFACPALFAAYQTALERIAQQANPEFALRHFELQLLDTLGYAIAFGVESGGERALQANSYYRFVPAIGFALQRHPTGRADEFIGAELLAISASCFDDEAALRAAKRLMRLAINHHLGGRPLNSRALFKPVHSD